MSDASITVRYRSDRRSSRTWPLPVGEKVLPSIRGNGFIVDTPCGGYGTCGRCAALVRINSQLQMQKLCLLRAQGKMEIVLPDPPGKTDVPEREPAARGSSDSSSLRTAADSDAPSSEIASAQAELGAAIDLGTTTIALTVIRLSDGSVLGSASEWNDQISFGADVISRISYCSSVPDGLKQLGGAVRKQIARMLGTVCLSAGIDLPKFPAAMRRMVVAGNTVMEHIFCGLDPSSIGQAPYTPLTRFEDFREWTFPEFSGCPVTVLPCVSGYVGGDILAGLLVSPDMDPASEGTVLFMDIGTNGEMVLKQEHRLLCCSTACGPAFEGASISCGMRGIAGAIEHVTLSGNLPEYQIIGQENRISSGSPEFSEAARGICGSGLPDLLAVLLQCGILEETGHISTPSEAASLRGYLTEDRNECGIFHLFPSGRLTLLQEDVRKLQLAKAAVCAGILTMQHAASVSTAQLSKILLAGGFGSHLHSESLEQIGMIPPGSAPLVRAVGNTSLEGALTLLKHPEQKGGLLRLLNACSSLELSGNSVFSDYFTDCLVFDSGN